MKHLARDGWPPARIVPEVKDEKPIGIRIFGVKPDSLLAAVGLQNGDRLEAWNGLALTKPEAVAEAFVNSADHARVRIALNRRGAPVTVEWEITDAPRTRAAVRR
jgi:general secretion pathway protein C